MIVYLWTGFPSHRDGLLFRKGCLQILFVLFAECCCLACDGKLFIGSNDISCDSAVVSGDLHDVAALFVCCLVELRAEIAEVLHDLAADKSAVLADAGCESDIVHTVHGSGISTDILRYTIAERFDRECAELVAFIVALLKITEVRGLAVGESKDTGLLVEDRYDLCCGHVLFACDELDDRGIQIAAAGAHDQALKRGKTHGSVNALAIAYCGDAGAVAQVADDGLNAVVRLADHFSDLLGNEGVAGAVEAIAADLVIPVIVHGDRVHISLLGHGLMESSIKDSYHGSLGHQSLAGIHADEVGGVVQRSQIGDILDSLNNFISNDSGGSELLAAMDDAVADSADLVERLQNAGLSQRPFARRASVSELMTWNFREELPQLITRIFIFTSPFEIMP